MKTRRILLALALALSLIGSPLLAIAQEAADSAAAESTEAVSDSASGIEVSPASFTLTAKPGAQLTREIKLTNPLSKEVTLFPRALDFYTDNDAGVPIFYYPEDEITSKYFLAKWISFVDKSITIEAKGTRTVEYSIIVPEDGEPGGHYAAVLFSTKEPSASETDTQVGVVGLIGSLVFLTVEGKVTQQLTISKFDAPQLTTASPVNLELLVKNTGNVHLKPQGIIEIRNWRKAVVSSLEVNKGGSLALPDSERKFTFKWENNWKNVGYYTASAELKYGDNQTPTSKQIAIIVLPVWFLITLGALLLLIILWIIRRYRRGKDEAATTAPTSPAPTAPSAPIASQATPVIAPVVVQPVTQAPTAPAVPPQPATTNPTVVAPAAAAPVAVAPVVTAQTPEVVAAPDPAAVAAVVDPAAVAAVATEAPQVAAPVEPSVVVEANTPVAPASAPKPSRRKKIATDPAAPVASDQPQ